MAGGAEMTPLAGECQEVFTCALQGMAAVFAFHTGKPVVDVAAIQIPVMSTVHFFKSPAPPEL